MASSVTSSGLIFLIKSRCNANISSASLKLFDARKDSNVHISKEQASNETKAKAAAIDTNNNTIDNTKPFVDVSRFDNESADDEGSKGVHGEAGGS